MGGRSYPGEIFGAGEAAFAGKGPEHAGSGGDETDAGEELGDDDDAGLELSDCLIQFLLVFDDGRANRNPTMAVAPAVDPTA